MTQESAGEHDRIDARAFDYASSYDLRQARELLVGKGGGEVLGTNPLIVSFGATRIVVVFEYGSVVLFNHSEPECLSMVEVLRPSAQRLNKTVARDDYTLVIAPQEKKPEGKDELTIREFTPDTAVVVAVVLSRSVALEYYEALVADSLARLERAVGRLAGEGVLPRGARRLTRTVGEAMLVEYELAHSVSAFDEPEIIWEGGARITHLYLALKREFDLDDRIKVIEQKVSLISRWNTFIISRLEGQRAQILEWVIILLILSEILLALFGKL